MLTLIFLDPLLCQTTINRDIERMYGSYEGKASRIRLFARLGSFRAKRPKLLIGIFFSRIDGKQQQID